MILLFLFILGLCFGSFINVVIDRLPRNESIFVSRSKCDKCKKQLSWFELIPVVSYLLLGGKCKSCKAKIPARIFIVELLCGALLVLIYLLGITHLIQLGIISLLVLILVAIFFIDLEEGVIPDQLLILFGVTSIPYIYFVAQASFLPHIIAGTIALIFFLLIFLATKGKGMGFGDVKFSFFIGFLLSGQNVIMCLYLAFLTGALVSIILVVGRKKKLRGSTIPFGPFLAASVVTTLLFQKELYGIFLTFAQGF